MDVGEEDAFFLSGGEPPFAALGLIEGGVFALAPFFRVFRIAVAVPVEEELIGDDQERARAAGGIDDLEFGGIGYGDVAAVLRMRCL